MLGIAPHPECLAMWSHGPHPTCWPVVVSGSVLHILPLLLVAHEEHIGWAAREPAARRVLVCGCSC